MQVTIVVSDNIVVVDGRPMKVDCSTLDDNIKSIHWYGDHGEIQFVNDPGKPSAFRRNGKLDSIGGEIGEIIAAWKAQIDKIDAHEQLKNVSPEEALRRMAKIESDPTLKTYDVDEALRLLNKVERDPDLADTPLNEAVLTIKQIESEPELAKLYPGPAHRELKRINEDPQLRTKPLKQAVKQLKERDESGGPKFKHKVPDDAELEKAKSPTPHDPGPEPQQMRVQRLAREQQMRDQQQHERNQFEQQLQQPKPPKDK